MTRTMSVGTPKGPMKSARISKTLLTGGGNDQTEQTVACSGSSSDGSESEEEEWELSCHCGLKEDNGEKLVQCNQCILRWEHVACIFPKTKQVPEGPYFCHVCRPRATELTPEQARSYQDDVQKKRKKRKSSVGGRRRRPSRSARSAALLKSEKSAANSASYREIKNCEYSEQARGLISSSITRPPLNSSSNTDFVTLIRDKPRAGAVMVAPNVFGLVTTVQVCEGDYVAELVGRMCSERECPNRDLVPGSLNDHTFLIENGAHKLVIDARQCGNFTKYLRRSCRPNAVLMPIFCEFNHDQSCQIHIMIKATQKLEPHDEVSIPLEVGWMAKPRPAQGCGCDKSNGKRAKSCELERVFRLATIFSDDMSSASREALPVNGIDRKPALRTASRARPLLGAATSVSSSDCGGPPSLDCYADAAGELLEPQTPDEAIVRPLRRSSRFTAQANESVEKGKERTPKKRELATALNEESMDDQPVEKTVRVDESTPDAPPAPSSPPSLSTPHSSTEVDQLREELAKMRDMYERSCQKTREAEMRAERAENLLDVKPSREDSGDLDKELKKRLAPLTVQLDKARGSIDKLHAEKQEFARENDSLKVKLVELESRVEDADRVNAYLSAKLTEVKEDLDTAGIAAQAPTANELDLAQENAALKEDAVKAAEEIAALNKKLDTAGKKETIANDKIGVLTRENLLLNEELEEMKKEEEKAKKK